jgi:lipoate-protein ligase A
MDGQVMTEVLRIGREKLSDKGTVSAAKRVDPLRRQTGMPRTDVVDKLLEVFTGRYDALEGAVGEHELAAARRLVETKFATPEWIARVP